MSRKAAVYLILGLIISWFIIIQLALISVPEVWGDEAFSATEVLHFLQNKQVVAGRIPFLNTYFPIMSDIRHGALEIYLLAPFMYLGGMTLKALRCGYIFWVVSIVIMTYIFATVFFNKRIALLSLLLLSVNSSFLQYAKMGGAYGLTIPFFSLGILLCFYYWIKTRKGLFFYLACFCLGLGFQIRGWFLWFIIALFISATFTCNFNRRLKLRNYFYGFLFFVLGFLPVIYFYISNLNYFLSLKDAFILTPENVNNLNFIGNIVIRFNNLDKISSGASPFLTASLLFLAYIVLVKQKSVFPKRRIVFLILLFISTFVLSVFTFTLHRLPHLYILFPYLQIVMSVAIFEAWFFSRSRLLKAGVIFLTLVFLFLNVRAYCLWIKDLNFQQKQISNSSINMLSDWLKSHRVEKVFGFDHPMLCALEFTSRLEVKTNMWEYKRTEEYIRDKVYNTKSEEFFIFVFPQDTLNLKYFTECVASAHKNLVLFKEFSYLDGSPRFKIFELE